MRSFDVTVNATYSVMADSESEAVAIVESSVNGLGLVRVSVSAQDGTIRLDDGSDVKARPPKESRHETFNDLLDEMRGAPPAFKDAAIDVHDTLRVAVTICHSNFGTRFRNAEALEIFRALMRRAEQHGEHTDAGYNPLDPDGAEVLERVARALASLSAAGVKVDAEGLASLYGLPTDGEHAAFPSPRDE